VCGLVMLELFKVIQKVSVSVLRTRQIGLACNTYTSFEANEPKTLSSGTEKKVPDAKDLPPEAFDAEGKIKAEYIVEEPYASYPEKHSSWDKLEVESGNMTLQEFKDWLKNEKKLDMKLWNFVLGWKMQEDADGKEMKVPYSAPIYPPPIQINYSLLPPLEDGQGDAMKKIMSSAQIPQNQKMKYLNEWKAAKASGMVQSAESSADVVKMDMTLKDILLLMEGKAETAIAEGKINKKLGKSITGVSSRKFWVIPPDQTPSCMTAPEGDEEPVDVRYLAAIKIPLQES